MAEIKATPESYVTSKLSPIVLSESQHVQISFEGRQVALSGMKTRNPSSCSPRDNLPQGNKKQDF